MSRTAQLARRRAMLIAQCQLQRTLLHSQSQALRNENSWLKSGSGLIQRLQQLPGWVNLALAAAVILIPGRITRLARGGLMLWQLFQAIKVGKRADPGAP